MLLLILFIGILLIILNVKAISKDKESFNSVLKEKSNGMDDFSVEIGKLRNEFGETIYELQQEIVNLKKELNIYKSEGYKVLNDSKLLDKDFEEDNELSYEEFEAEIEEDREFEDEFNHDKAKELINDQVYNEINFNSKVTTYNDSDKNSYNHQHEKKASVKYEEIEKLLKEGFSVNEISEKLNMGKGEVLLIIELYLK